jgi:hypothetical protein
MTSEEQAVGPVECVCERETACKSVCVFMEVYIEKCHMVVEFVMLRDACVCSSNVGVEL